MADWEPVLAYGTAPEGSQLVHRVRTPARTATMAELPADVEPSLASALAAAGIERLYRHQAAMWRAAAERDAMVVTGTASGKSLAFNLPVLDAIARDPSARALYLYPTKALAQDQARGLAQLHAPGARPAIYDGDTPTGERRQARRWANLILTNPDMLHVGILPGHSRWADAIANLRYVVVDEAHAYRGVFGSHVANVLARLRRIAACYGAEPRFLLASATIANPGEAGAVLAGRELTVIDQDGSPSAERDVCVWNPPLLDVELGVRASTLGEAATLMVGLVARGLRTIVFAKSRKACELVHRYARQGLLLNAPELAPRIAPYRAGYTPEQRREIQTGLTEGRLLGVVATSALELGVDIGLLDCAISIGFPGGMASLRQQWGRAGRRGLGLGVLVAGGGPAGPDLAKHPHQLAGRAGARDARGWRGPARPVPRKPPRRAAGAAGRGGCQQPGQPGGDGRAPALRRRRASADRRRPQPLRRRRPGAGRVDAGSGAHAGRAGVPRQRPSGRAHVVAIVLAGLGGCGGARDRHAAGNRGRRPRRLDRPRGRRLPAPG